MALKFLDRCAFAVASAPGTGAITVGAALAGEQTPIQADSTYSTGDQTPYTVTDGIGVWEHGLWTYNSSGPTLTRTLRSSSTGALLNLSTNAVVTATVGAKDLAALGAITPTPLSAAATVSVGAIYDVDTSAGAFTATLPTSPADKSTVVFRDVAAAWGTNALTVAAGGSNKIDKTLQITSLNLNLARATVTFEFWATGTTWMVLP